MARYSHIPKEIQQELLTDFCEALLTIKTPEEAVKFLTDLLTKSEVIMLAKRIKIAKLLIEGKDYKTIEGRLKVSHSTIAKVAAWLVESGEGFRLITERTKKEKPKPPTSWDYAMGEWKSFKRRYPTMFWPQLLIEEIIESANKKQREKIRRAIEKLDHKSKLYKQINKILIKNL
jgi:TrpR-related protein YerC/YecD